MSSTEPLMAAPAGAANAYRFEQFAQSTTLGTTPTSILSAARAEAERIREAARATGEAEGFAEGVRQGGEHAAPAADTLRAAARELEQVRERLLDEITAQAAELAISIAEQILSATLELRPEQVLEVTRTALRRLTDRTRVTVAVSPEDLELLNDNAGRIKLELGGIEHLDVRADRRVARGGAVVSTESGEIDCTIDAQLQSVREIVAATLDETQSSTDPEPTAGLSSSSSDTAPRSDPLSMPDATTLDEQSQADVR